MALIFQMLSVECKLLQNGHFGSHHTHRCLYTTLSNISS